MNNANQDKKKKTAVKQEKYFCDGFELLTGI